MPFASAAGRTDRYKGGWRCDMCNRSEGRDVARLFCFSFLFRPRSSEISFFCNALFVYSQDIGVMLVRMMFALHVQHHIDAKNHLQMHLMRFYFKKKKKSFFVLFSKFYRTK